MSLQTQKETVLKLKLKMIAVSEENYFRLKRLGSAGDSFNDVVTEILKDLARKEKDRKKVGVRVEDDPV